MRKVIYGGACSLDGYLAGRNGELDWLHHSKDVGAIMAETWSNTDTMLLGRKTWEFANSMPAPKDAGAFAGIKSFVFSRTLGSLPDRKAELVSDDAGGFVRKLKSQPGKNIIVMSGGNLAASLLEAGVIDEVGLNIHPVLLGGGPAAFLDPKRRIKLELTETRQLDGGCVFVRYNVKR